MYGVFKNCYYDVPSIYYGVITKLLFWPLKSNDGF